MIASVTGFIAGFDVPFEVVVLGVITGLTYALLGVGLTLVYRSAHVVNFAHGEMGALPAALVPLLVLEYDVPYALAIVTAVAVGAAVGVGMELAVIRRLARSSRLIVMVATIGVAQLLLGAQLLLPQGTNIGAQRFPTPFDASVRIGGLRLGSGQLLILCVAPLLVAGLTVLLNRSRLGLAVRASADNLDAARLSGMRARRVSLVVWLLAALLATLSAILAGPTRPLGLQVALGPALMLRALAAAMIGGLTNLPLVFAGGVAIGVIEFVVLWNDPGGGILELALFVIIVGALVVRPRLGQLTRGGEERTWSLSGALGPLPAALAAAPRVRAARWLGLVVLLAVAILAPLPLDSAQRVLLASVALFALMGLSIVVLTGFAGQLSLGQFAFVGLGALVGGRMAQLDYPGWMQVLYAAVAGAVAALAVGVPALRLRGLFLAVTTLGFAVAAGAWLPRQDWLVHESADDSSLEIPRQEWFGIDFTNDRNFYWLSLAVLVVACVLVHRVRRTGIGRTLEAVRDNEPFAASLSVRVRRTKLNAFVLSGAIAAVAGYFYGALLVSFGGSTLDSALFSPANSLTLVAMVIFGGVTSITGAILGALWVRGIPYLFGDEAGVLSSGLGLLVVLLVLRGGLASVAFRVRDAIAARLAGALAGADDAVASSRATVLVDDDGKGGEPALALACEGIVVRYGGIDAVAEVSLHAAPGEIVGLIGPNGAGKTTLFDALSGHVQPSAGIVRLGEHDVSLLRPEERARLGLGRTFQQARLFGEMTLLDTVKVALERQRASAVVPSLLALPPSLASEREKDERARDVLDRFGLGPLALRRCAELSTGTRRLVELACAAAMDSRVLLLDEPTAGLAPDEVTDFVPLLRDVRDRLDATMVLIAHDVPVVMDVADRVYVLAAGRLIAEGPPQQVREDPRVLTAYFGITDEEERVADEVRVPV